MDISTGLLSLVDDGQRIIFEELADPLDPGVALKLSACCNVLFMVSKAVRADLREKHNAARRLCTRVNTTCAAVVETEELLWYGQGLSVAHMGTVGTMLASLPNLKLINLSINRFGAAGLQALLAQLGHRSLPTVRCLDLTGNCLGAAGAAALADALRHGTFPKLEVLKLGRNDIGNQGLAALGPPLRQLPALKEVYLYSNQIGDEGVQALVANLGVERLKQLEKLNLERNKMSDVSCATLIEALDRWSCTCCERREERPPYCKNCERRFVL